jgi:hypothetical protein
MAVFFHVARWLCDVSPGFLGVGAAGGSGPLVPAGLELILAPGMVVDANELAVRYAKLEISTDAGDNTPETLLVRMVGRMKYGQIGTRWLAPSG